MTYSHRRRVAVATVIAALAAPGAALALLAPVSSGGPGVVGDLIATVSWRKTDASSKRYPKLKGWTLVVTPQPLCRTVCSRQRRAAGWLQVEQGVKALHSPRGAPRRLNHSMYEQFVCHAFAGRHKATWDLDTYRPDTTLAREFAHACNPPNGNVLSVIEGR